MNTHSGTLLYFSMKQYGKGGLFKIGENGGVEDT